MWRVRFTTYLLPNRGSATQTLARVLLRFRLVALDDSSEQLGLIHVVYGFARIF